MQFAFILAEQAEPGFCFLRPEAQPRGSADAGCIFKKVLCRLGLIGDTAIVSKQIRKRASHCGGVPPNESLAAFPETPWLADPGNEVYGRIVRRLFMSQVAQDASEEEGARIYHISNFNDEHLGDLVEAALAAANVAACIEKGSPHEWRTLCGGAHADGDTVTRFLVRAVHWECRV